MFPDLMKVKKYFKKTLRYHQVEIECVEVRKHMGKGRPKKGEEAQVVGYKLRGSLSRNEESIAAARNRKGRFVLATNELDQNKLPDANMLDEYKAQSKTESGFRFIKNDTFEVDIRCS